MELVKMQGLGNDFVVADLRGGAALTDPGGWARWLCSRRFGIGADGLILLSDGGSDAGADGGAEVTMTIHNADGSQAEMCGNALRCVGRWAHDRAVAHGRLTVRTAKGRNTVTWSTDADADGRVTAFTAQVAAPDFTAANVPMLTDSDRAIDLDLEAAGRPLRVTAMSFGNPHCVTFVPDLAAVDVATMGPAITSHDAFPEQVNAEFVEVIDAGHVRMRVHERGVGETLACGSGSCAAVAAGVVTGRTAAIVDVEQPGGTLRVEYDIDGDRCLMTGPAEQVFTTVLDMSGPPPQAAGHTPWGDPVFAAPPRPTAAPAPDSETSEAHA